MWWIKRFLNGTTIRSEFANIDSILGKAWVGTYFYHCTFPTTVFLLCPGLLDVDCLRVSKHEYKFSLISWNNTIDLCQLVQPSRRLVQPSQNVSTGLSCCFGWLVRTYSHFEVRLRMSFQKESPSSCIFWCVSSHSHGMKGVVCIYSDIITLPPITCRWCRHCFL